MNAVVNLFAYTCFVLVHSLLAGCSSSPEGPADATAVKVNHQAKEKPDSFTNSQGMKFKKIGAGKFQAGQLELARFEKIYAGLSDIGEKLEILSLLPPKRMETISKDFWIAETETTVGQFRKFVQETGYVTDAERLKSGGTGKLSDGRFGNLPKFKWDQVGFELVDDHPVVNVSWNDAQAFCKWLSKKENRTYRLPTELEWEMSCRAGGNTLFNSGDPASTLKGHANVADQSLKSIFSELHWATKFDDGYAFLAPVASFQANKYGIYDMHGNVMEWCQNVYKFSDSYPKAKFPESGDSYCLKGGNWFNDPNRCNSACRIGGKPTLAMSLIGFRIVLEDAAAK